MFRVLGGVTAEVDGSEVELPGQLRRLVGILLAERGRAVALDVVVDRLWEAPPPRTATKVVHVLVGRLRRALDPSGTNPEHSRFVRTVPGGYLLVPDATDVDEHAALVAAAQREAGRDPLGALARLDAARSLWLGRPWGAQGDEPWLRATADELEERARAAEELWGDLALRVGRVEDAARVLRAAVAAEPLRERRWAQLMVALYRTGRQADALRAYEELRTLLRDQLGIEPGPELRRIQLAVLQHDRSLLEDPALPDVSGASSFIGRADDLARLDRALAHSRLVTVVGFGGLGKTRLVAELAHRRGLAGATVRWARLGSLSAPERLARHVASAAGLQSDAGVDDVDLIAAAMGSAAELLVLDAAEDVAAEVAALALRLLERCPRLRIIVTSRVPLAIPAEQLLELRPLPMPASRLDVTGSAVELLLARLGVDLDEIGDALYERLTSACAPSGGVPLLVELTVRTLDLPTLASSTAPSGTDAPASQSAEHADVMRKAIDSALDAVDDVARTIVRRAAPLPAGVSEELAIGLLDEPEGPVRRALRQLAWQQLVDVAPGASGLRYRSLDPVRQALAGELSPAARADGLTRATAALLGIARSIRPSLAAPIVVSRLEAVEDEHDNIRFVLADALVASPSAALDLAVAMAELWPVRGHIVEGRRWLIAAIDATGSEGAPWWRGTIALAKVTRTFAEMATMRSSLEAVVDAMRHDSDEPLLFGLGLLYLSIARGWQGDRAGAAVAIDEAAAIDRRDGTPWTAAHIEHLRAFDLALGGDLLGAREGQRTFARRMEALDDPFGAAMGWYLAASMGDLAGRSDLDDDISKARALATSTHDVALLGQLLRVEGSLLQRTGDARGRELLGEAADRLAAGGGLRAAALAWRDLGLLDLASGDDVAAAASLRRAVAALLHLERPAAALACAGLATIAQRRGEESASARLVAGAAALRTHETAAPAADAARLDALLADLPAAPHDAAINDDDVLEAADLLA